MSWNAALVSSSSWLFNHINDVSLDVTLSLSLSCNVRLTMCIQPTQKIPNSSIIYCFVGSWSAFSLAFIIKCLVNWCRWSGFFSLPGSRMYQWKFSIRDSEPGVTGAWWAVWSKVRDRPTLFDSQCTITVQPRLPCQLAAVMEIHHQLISLQSL